MGITGFVQHPTCLEHEAGPGHPERPERLSAVLERLRVSGLEGELDRRVALPASAESIERVHAPGYVRTVERAAASGRARLDDGDTYVCDASFEAALLASGGALQAVEHVIDGTWDNAFVAVRPPGHHAEHDRAMGFCLFNSVAVAASELRARHGIERVAIVDWDVHHGNGTQHSFEHDPNVFFASMHQHPHYPGTGAADERGLGAGEGATLNLPMPAGSGDLEWSRAFEQQLLPALEAFAPQFVLVSAGFDAHVDDPLADCRLEEQSFARMTRGLLEVAQRCAGGQLVALLEGGYDLDALGRSVEAHLGALRGA